MCSLVDVLFLDANKESSLTVWHALVQLRQAQLLPFEPTASGGAQHTAGR